MSDGEIRQSIFFLNLIRQPYSHYGTSDVPVRPIGYLFDSIQINEERTKTIPEESGEEMDMEKP